MLPNGPLAFNNSIAWEVLREIIFYIMYEDVKIEPLMEEKW